MSPGPRHRHGFAVLINGAGRIATMQLAFVCSSSVVWGCQRAGEYAIKGRFVHATQPLFVFRAHVLSYSGVNFSIGRFVRSLGPRFLQATAFGSLLCP
jgi:hypothetical protein